MGAWYSHTHSCPFMQKAISIPVIILLPFASLNRPPEKKIRILSLEFWFHIWKYRQLKSFSTNEVLYRNIQMIHWIFHYSYGYLNFMSMPSQLDFTVINSGKMQVSLIWHQSAWREMSVPVSLMQKSDWIWDSYCEIFKINHQNIEIRNLWYKKSNSFLKFSRHQVSKSVLKLVSLIIRRLGRHVVLLWLPQTSWKTL